MFKIDKGFSMRKKSLQEYFKELQDIRRIQGRRHSLDFTLTIILMATMSNYHGYRAIGDFAECNKDDLIKYLKPSKPRVPSYSTIRRVLMSLDFNHFKEIFFNWATQYIDINQEDYLSIDGKSIRSTLSDYSTAYQDFVSIVSVFSQRQKQVLAMEKYHNKKVSEISLVQDLLEQLDLQGKTITLDALHCKKNYKND